MNIAVLIEALFVGIIVVVIGVIGHIVTLKLYGHHDLNDMYMFAGHLFMIGVAVHLICEFVGINKWYCNNGTACKQYV